MNQTVRVAMVTLGCAKNLVDTEHMLGLLAEAGFRTSVEQAAAEEPEAVAGADLCVVNTCGFIDAAKEESVETILRLADLKKQGRLGGLIVAGCLAQRYAAELQAEIPEVDAVVGTGDFPRIVEVAREVLGGGRAAAVGVPAYAYDRPLPRVRTTPAHTAYLKIAEGCDHACAFCIIPQLRGAYRSRPLSVVVAEAEALAAAGVKEINLVSQDSTFYGWDLAGRLLLPELLRELNKVAGLRWIRFLYNYPTRFTAELARTMAALEKVCRYVDIPLQHGSDRILAAMGRGGRRADIIRRIGEIRRVLPDAVFRSSFIVGFPGESEDDFQELLSFLDEIAFDYVGFFTYSLEEGTPAGAMPGQVPRDVKEARYHRAMARQRHISLRRQSRHVGQTLEVLVEGDEPGQPGFYRGRWRGQAPEVDGQVVLRCETGAVLRPGDMVKARIERAEEYDLHGVVSG